jgi:predicted porin
MKKSLVAVAVLGAFTTISYAQTTVSIGGVIQANIKNYKISNTTRAAKNELRVDDDYTTRFWLTGTEDLGGGLKALFYIENRLNADVSTPAATANGLGNGDTYVGLRGNWGQVTLGKHSWMNPQGLVTEFVSASGNLVAMPTSMTTANSLMNQAGGYLDITRRVNSVTYRSPVFNGFNGVLGVSAASAGNEGVINGSSNYNDGREYYLQGGYNNGPLSVSLAYRDFTAEGRPATGIDEQQLRFSGSYKFGSFKAGVLLDRAAREDVGGGKSSRTGWAIPVSYIVGNSTILASFGKAGDLSVGSNNMRTVTGAVANTGNDTGAKMWTLGYDYALSKRTNVGVYYSRLDNDARGQYVPVFAGTSLTGSPTLAGETASTFALGIKHTF